MASEPWAILTGELPTPKGFKASGVACGLKRAGEDLALIFSERPSVGAAVFTTNIVKAAPILVSQSNLSKSQGKIRAIVVNAGCANACTGKKGLEVAADTAKLAARLLKVKSAEVLVASTGVIGKLLDFSKIERGLPHAVDSLTALGLSPASRAIMTTDTIPKIYVLRGLISSKEVTIAGIAKGSGMINPNLATMLAFIATDAAIQLRLLDRALRECVDKTFNSITVDGDTSTNDTVAILANGAAGNKKITSEGREFSDFYAGLLKVCEYLSRAIVHDGEGASKFIEIHVKGAREVAEAKKVAKTIANSPLVKTAVYGGDANWGRIICAAGNSGVPFDPDVVDLHINGECVLRNGAAHRFSMAKLQEELKGPRVKFTLHLNQGRKEAVVWTCDLSHEYVSINSSYTT